MLATVCAGACGADPVATTTPMPNSNRVDSTESAITTACQDLSQRSWITTSRLTSLDGREELRIGVMEPQAPVIGDVLYLHGFADRLDNHRPLFDAWSQAGFRVISFDYPSHGETCGASINGYTIDDLMKLAAQVESATIQDRSRPLVLAGWSTGGLLAARILQVGSESPIFSRPVSKAILIAPGVALRPLLGEFGIVTQSTLTRNPNPPHEGEIKPKSPLSVPLFALNLLAESNRAKAALLPNNVPVLVVVGGIKEDRYVDTTGIIKWVGAQRENHKGIIRAVACAGGYHELDNEPDPMGNAVRNASAEFAKDAAKDAESDILMATEGCTEF